MQGDLKKSPMHARISLDSKDEDFMPPKDEKPLTKEQVQAIGFWIEGKPIPDEIAKAALEANKSAKK